MKIALMNEFSQAAKNPVILQQPTTSPVSRAMTCSTSAWTATTTTA